MNEELTHKIRERAFEIYEYRKENNLQFILDEIGYLREITQQDDWLEAEQEILTNNHGLINEFR